MRNGSGLSWIAVVVLSVLVANTGWSGGGPERPKVGLVLSGGGALGIAHIGVLKVLEEERIPIDYIGGTSMGSIIAGFYASGMSPEEIETALVAMDWWDILQDATPRRQLEPRRKEDTRKYLFNIELGLRGKRILAPSGLAAGQKFNNVLQTLTLPAAGVYDFDDLNIPFRCVATDLDTKKAVILDHGNLGTAQRASMAVPGMFTPVRLEGKTLVDGGIVNNIPVDVVRDMGAEILIAVDVGDEGTNIVQRDWESLGDILGQTYAILQRPKEMERLASANVVVAPDLSGYTASDFHKTAALVDRGYEKADQQRTELSKYAVSKEEYDAFLKKQRRAPQEPITISSVRIEGLKRVDERRVQTRIETEAGNVLDTDKLDDDLGRVYGMGHFETVTYFLRPTNGTHELSFVAREKPWGPGFLHFGLRLENDFERNTTWDALVDYTRSLINPLGGEFRVDLQWGSKDMLLVEVFQPLNYSGLFFVLPRAEFSAEKIGIYSNQSRIAEYEVDRNVGMLALGCQFTHYGYLWAGYEGGQGRASADTGAGGLPSFDGGLGAIRSVLELDQLDDPIFARSGFLLNLEGRFAREGLGEEVDYDKLKFLYQGYSSFGNHTIRLKLLAESGLHSDLPAYNPVLIGGVGTFPGLAPNELRGQQGGVVSPGYRYRISQLPPSLGKGIYIDFGLNAGNVWQNSDEISTDDLIYGGSVSLGADTVLGPAYVGAASAESGRIAYYFSLGSQF